MLAHPPRILLLAVAALLGNTLLAQQNNAADRMALARGLYYTPTTAGLHSFQCAVHTDWKDLLQRVGQQDVAADNPFLAYLNATRLSAYDQLNGAGSLTWTNDAPVPESKDEAVSRMRSGMIQMFQGFFQSWNAYMDGSMVPLVDKTVMVRNDGDGVELHVTSKDADLTEHFDRNMLLTTVHVATTQMEVTAYPAYTDSPDGRLITSVRSLLHQPPAAPALEVTFDLTYAKVGSYMLPATLHYGVKNVAQFHFTLSGCVINPR
jgi:hypothetical protein